MLINSYLFSLLLPVFVRLSLCPTLRRARLYMNKQILMKACRDGISR